MERKSKKTSQNRSGRQGKKRKFQGNRFTGERGSDFTSKSAEKLVKSKDATFNVHIDQTSGYSIISFFLVFLMMSKYLKCYLCPIIGSGYEVNRRLVIVMRLQGVGIHGKEIFCSLMDLQ